MNPQAVVSVIFVAAVAAGCSPDRRVEEIDPPRVVETRVPRLGASSQQRFGGGVSPAAPQAEPAAPELAYDLPPGWTELPPAQFRDVNLAAPDGVKAWVTVMGPGAGGPLGNLTRWRGQLGLPAPTQQDLDALPEVDLLGGRAKLIDLLSPSGTQRLIVAMLFEADRSVFVRMDGKPDAVTAQLDAFAAFRTSLRDRTAAAQPKPPKPAVGTAAGADAPGVGGAGDFQWTVPDGWVPVGSSPFKLFEFRSGDDTSCWLSELQGDGGGFASNINRWCTQVGRPPMTPADLEALPRLDVLGKQVAYVPLLAEGRAEGLLGVVVPLDGRTLFVKMAGPSDALRARQAQFEEFCRSLAVKG